MFHGSISKIFAAILIATLIQTAAVAGSNDIPAQGVASGYINGGGAAQPIVGDRYPRLNAPLYPAPVQYAPSWNGATIITNQALAPHEMLYPHQYRALYPPFYYRVKGGWIVTPLGVKQNEVWKLQGTEVKVDYHAHRSPFARFFRPPR
jgi:hypothetical protein